MRQSVRSVRHAVDASFRDNHTRLVSLQHGTDTAMRLYQKPTGRPVEHTCQIRIASAGGDRFLRMWNTELRENRGSGNWRTHRHGDLAGCQPLFGIFVLKWAQS